jgi:hypothetical protein
MKNIAALPAGCGKRLGFVSGHSLYRYRKFFEIRCPFRGWASAADLFGSLLELVWLCYHPSCDRLDESRLEISRNPFLVFFPVQT